MANRIRSRPTMLPDTPFPAAPGKLHERIPCIAVPRGKGGRIATVPLVPEGVAAARALLAARAFGPWSRGSANKALRTAARCAGRTAFTVYQIRHSFAASLRLRTDVADIQDLYGHTSTETTMIYAPPELPKHRAAMERLRDNDAHPPRPPAFPNKQVQVPPSRDATPCNHAFS